MYLHLVYSFHISEVAFTRSGLHVFKIALQGTTTTIASIKYFPSFPFLLLACLFILGDRLLCTRSRPICR
jgi:hypothetical protein